MQDRIEKSIDLNAPIDRVWRALTNHEEFGEWFRVKLDAVYRQCLHSRGHQRQPDTLSGAHWTDP